MLRAARSAISSSDERRADILKNVVFSVACSVFRYMCTKAAVSPKTFDKLINYMQIIPSYSINDPLEKVLAEANLATNYSDLPEKSVTKLTYNPINDAFNMRVMAHVNRALRELFLLYRVDPLRPQLNKMKPSSCLAQLPKRKRHDFLHQMIP